MKKIELSDMMFVNSDGLFITIYYLGTDHECYFQIWGLRLRGEDDKDIPENIMYKVKPLQ